MHKVTNFNQVFDRFSPNFPSNLLNKKIGLLFATLVVATAVYLIWRDEKNVFNARMDHFWSSYRVVFKRNFEKISKDKIDKIDKKTLENIDKYLRGGIHNPTMDKLPRKFFTDDVCKDVALILAFNRIENKLGIFALKVAEGEKKVMIVNLNFENCVSLWNEDGSFTPSSFQKFEEYQNQAERLFVSRCASRA